MPNKPNATKALRQAKKRSVHNLRLKRGVKASVKAARTSILDNKEIEEKLKQAVQTLDKAAKKGILKKQAAARKKSRLYRLLRKHKTS